MDSEDGWGEIEAMSSSWGHSPHGDQDDDLEDELDKDLDALEAPLPADIVAYLFEAVEEARRARRFARQLWRDLTPAQREDRRVRGLASPWAETAQGRSDDGEGGHDDSGLGCICGEPVRAAESHDVSCPVFRAWSHRVDDSSVWEAMRLDHPASRALARHGEANVPRDLAIALACYHVLVLDLLYERDQARVWARAARHDVWEAAVTGRRTLPSWLSRP